MEVINEAVQWAAILACLYIGATLVIDVNRIKARRYR